MLRSVILAVLSVASLGAAIWPEHLGKFERKSSKSTVNSDEIQTQDYGFEESEEANYGQFQVTASRYKDATGAYAASLAAAGHPLQTGNYLISCSGACPKNLAALAEALPQINHSALPTLRNYLPAKNIVPHTERYVLGPLGLKAVAPQIPESAVAFQFAPEGEIARYREPGGEVTLAVFSYPTMEMARQQAAAMEKIPSAFVKRSGPLVALALAPANRAEADRLLAQINYQAVLSSDDQQLPLVLKPQTAAQMILAIIALAGIVLGFCLFSGLLFGALRVAARRFGYSDAGTPYTRLHLSDK
jgi:hypothetical protein